ncbi:hypothetical protein LTR85_010868 [Meristemomyces frigidus]|nr:hypothetical protein LTR85_010868 [Meristemomyces frigidus]
MGSHPQGKPDWANLSVLHRNTLHPRANFVLYNSEEDALSRDIIKAKAQCLSGNWKFQLDNSPFDAPPGFEGVSFDSSKWSDITVPGMWQLQGFGRGSQYVNVQFPFHVDPPVPPYSSNECGSYITHFVVAETLKNHQLRLRFEGVDSSFHVWINGIEIGYSQGSRNPSEFDITQYVRERDQNKLAVRVYQYCDGSYIEDQDQWRLSGIFRDVFLLGFPAQTRFMHVMIRTVLDEVYRDATLEVQVDVEGHGTLGLRLLDAEMKEIETASQTTKKHDYHRLKFSVPIGNPEKWTAETPYLYNLVLGLNGAQYMAHRVGFRQVEMKDGLIKVNGKRVVFKGANRHEHSPLLGRTVPVELLMQDLLLMKTHNINAIRTCHQPSDPRLYDLADELGFWVMDEADLECHGFEMIADAALPAERQKLPFAERQRLTRADAAKWTSDNPEWRDAYIDRARQLVHRDQLHPCVIMWSLGNEAFYGRNHTVMRDWIKHYDPTRPIHYEPDVDAEHMDMYSKMYPQVQDIVDFANDKTTKDKPLVLCEYIHAMGTGPGNIKEYVDAFYEYPRLQGGWVWEWANHGLLTRTEDGTPYYGYGGDFGDVPNDYDFVMDGVLQSDHTPNSGLLEYKKALEPVQTLSYTSTSVTIINRMDFKSLDHLSCVWSVVDETGVRPGGGTIEIPTEIQPSSTAALNLPDVEGELVGEAFIELSFRLRSKMTWADAGHELAWAQVPITEPGLVTKSSSAGRPTLKTTETGSLLTVMGDGFDWTIDLVRGSLSAWKKDGIQMISQPLVPTFYRAPTDNDAPKDGKDWKDKFLYLAKTQTRAIEWHQGDDGSVVVEAQQKFAPPVLSWSLDLAVAYIFEPSGTVKIHIKGIPTGANLPETLPRIGVTLGLSKGFQNVEWFGRGPGEKFPQECSNRTDTRWVKVSDGVTTLTAQFYGPKGADKERRLFDFMASHYDIGDIDAAQHPYELERKKQDSVILRLDADHHGLGTGSCGPKTLEQYALKTTPFEFAMMLLNMKSITIEFCHNTPRSQLLFKSIQERLLVQEMAGEIRLLESDDITGITSPLLSPGCLITSPTPSFAAGAQAGGYFAYANLHIPSQKVMTATATPETPSKRPELKRS